MKHNSYRVTGTVGSICPGRNRGLLPTILVSMLCLLLLLPTSLLATVRQTVLFRTSAGSPYQLYVAATREVITLAGTQNMNNAILGDVDGNGRQDDIIYTNASTGGLGYYSIPSDAAWHSERNFAIPNTHRDAVSMTTIRTSAYSLAETIVYRAASTGQAYSITRSGSGSRALGRMDKAYAVDAKLRGYKSDLASWVNGVGMKWREGLTGADRSGPYNFMVPIGGGKVVPNLTNRTMVFYAVGYGTYACDQNWNLTWIQNMVWPWITNDGSSIVGDIDSDGLDEIIFCQSATGTLQWYNVPSNGAPWNSAGVVTENNVKCGWNLRGIGKVDLTVSSTPPPPVPEPPPGPTPGPTPVAVSNIGNIRTIADNTLVQVSAKPRTKLIRELDSSLKPVATGFYVEETDRSAGIRVQGTTTAAEGQLVSVTGTLGTLNGERVIAATQETVSTQTSMIAPLTATIDAIYTATTATGLLVKVDGSVSSANKAAGYFTLSSGSRSVKVYCPDFTITSGAASVTGCVGAEKNTSGSVEPVLRVQAGGDIASTEPPSVAAKYSVWTRTGLDKVLKADAAQTLTTPTIRAARNEQEAFQIVMRTGSTSVSSVSVTAGALTSTNAQIPASSVSISLPNYIYLPAFGKDYPDALPPYQAPFNMAASQTQPIWVEVTVPKTATPGDYNGTVTIADASGARTNVPYVLHVYNFTLPDTHKTATSFGLWPQYIAKGHSVSVGSTQYQQLHKKYYELMLQHGVSTFYDQPLYPFPDALFTTEGASYITDPRVTAFWIPYYSGNPAMMKRIVDRLKQLGVYDKHYYYYHDEPGTQAQFTQLQQMCNTVKSVDPGARVVIPYWNDPDWTTQTVYNLLSGYINIWCPITDFWDRYPNQTSALNARSQAGETVWSYTASGPSLPYANYHINYAMLETRMMTWQNYIYDATGLLFWCVNCWEFVSDPWTEPDTIKGGSAAYGGGSMLYPGKKVGIDGPVGSLRLKALRDSLEDYDYLWLLEQKIGRANVLPYVQKLAQSWTSYTKNTALFESTRDEIARRIEQ